MESEIFMESENMEVTEAEVNTNGTAKFRDDQFLSLIQVAYEEQGPYEVEITYKAEYHYEVDPSRKWNNCRKDPKHNDFIQIDKFTINSLPDPYRVPELYDLIKHLAHLTVKITISSISSKRPSLHPNGGPYPAYSNMSGKIFRSGSGRVWDVRKIDGQPCPCEACKALAKPRTSWGEVNIVTATHVVFDDEEGKNTTCYLGFDNANSNNVALEGTGVGRAEIVSDLSYVRCVTHDVGLVDQLDIHLDEFKNRCEEMFERFRDDNPGLIVIVSHPHGYYKQVSVGERVHCEQTSSGDSKYMYTTSTCPGSSGAPVYILGKERGWWCSHHHSGAAGVGVNISGIGWL